METTIFYFSATGNSLSLTRKMANALGHCKLIPMATVVNNPRIDVTTPRVGLIFPVYAWGMPRIVEECVSKLSFSGNPYIFSVVTCVAIQGNTLFDLRKHLRRKGVELHAGFAVKAGRSSLMKMNALDIIIMRLDRHRLHIKTAEERMPELVATIGKLALHKPERSSLAATRFGSLFHGLGMKTFKQVDRTFVVEDACTGCGTCANLCPRSNIVIENGRPVFLHNCELCHACIQWCPNFAIKHRNFDDVPKQYRNDSVNVSDMIYSKIIRATCKQKSCCSR